MFALYFSSILVWMIIIYSLILLFKRQIVDNGWLNKAVTTNTNGYVVLFAISAVPIIRFLMAIGIVIMAYYTEDELNELTKRNDEED